MKSIVKITTATSLALCMALAICMISTVPASAQEPVFGKGDNVVSLGVGLGGSLYNGYGYKGSGFSRMPAFSLAFERCIIDELFDEKSSLGIGALLGYTSAKYNDSGWGWKSTDIMIGARGALHYALVNKLDTYAGMMLGYNINTWKWTGYDWSTTGKSGSSGLSYAIFAGARYYFTDSIAAFAELGFGYSIINVGIALKF